MKKYTTNLNPYLHKLLFAFVIVFLSPLLSKAAESTTAAEKKPPSLEFVQYKNSNGTRTLKASLHYVENKERKALRNAEIVFFAGADKGLELAKVKTTLKGEASYIIPASKALPLEEGGLITVGAKFTGNDKFEEIDDQVSVKNLNFRITANGKDSIKTVMLKAYELSSKGEAIPVAEASVILYVQRYFSALKVGEAKTDVNGDCSIDFPAGLPGDTTGDLKVFARIEENETFGNAEADTLLNWGIPTVHKVPGSYKALWSQVAPTWMVQTLIILLGGVWGHYAYAVYKLFKIRRIAKMDEYEKFGV